MEFGIPLLNVDIVLVVLCIILLTIYVFKKDKYPNLPPGPRGLPLFGNLLSLKNAEDVSRLLTGMAKQYGPVVRLWLGSDVGIVLNGYDVIKEALVDKSEYFSGRPKLESHKMTSRSKGILMSNEWKEKRRMALMSMRDFGLGKRSLEERMRDEASILLSELEKHQGKYIDLPNLMPVVTTNIICTIIRGERFNYGDDTMRKIVDCFQAVINKSEFDDIDNYISWINYIPKAQQWKSTRDNVFMTIANIMRGWIDEHRQTFDGDNIRDLIDLFLSEIEKNKSTAQTPGNFVLKEENIMPLVFDLFAAGTETTSTTLQWCIAYFVSHKDIQSKCRQEIIDAVGRSKIPSYAETKDLPYLNAFINETQRMGNILPLSLPHATTDRVELRGFTIPKNAKVIVNLESALKDENYWCDPYTFRPERWLDVDGKLLKHQAFIPFSTGKRECLGELLAKKEIFIFLSAMMQNFEFELEEGAKPPNLSKGCGRIRTAPNIRAIVKKI